MIVDETMTRFLNRWQQSNILDAYRLTAFKNGLCFSLTFFFNKIDDKTGTKVSVKRSAPNKANPKVYANGLNIFPSTF